MRNPTFLKSLYFCCGIFIFFIIVGDSFAYDKAKQKSKEENPLKLLLKEYAKVDTATRCARNAAKAFADSSFIPDVLFNLSEWELRKSKVHFNVEMEKFDKKMKLFEKDTSKYTEPEEPFLSFQPTININWRMLKDYQNLPYRDKLLYRTGICLYETGKPDSAKALFWELINQYPDSLYIPEVTFRLGECYFDEQEFEKALHIYTKILKTWDSPFFAMALYKKAWCHYQLNDYPRSISTFYFLLSDIQLLEELNLEILGKNHAELLNEVIEYIAMSFTDFGGIQLMHQFSKYVGESNYLPHILQKMAELYFKRDFWEESILVYNYLINRYPFYEEAPQVQYDIFTCYEKMGNMDKAFDIRNTIKKKYGDTSEWAQQNSKKENQELVQQLVKTIDMKIATPYLHRADSLYAAGNYDLSVKNYKNFLKTFPNDDRADHAAYFLAESYYQHKNYLAAAVSFGYATKSFPQSELREDAAYNRVVCYDLLDGENSSAENDTLVWELNYKLFAVPLQSKTKKNALLAIKDFVHWFPQSEKSVELKLKLAETFINAGQNNLAELYLNSALVSIKKRNLGTVHYAHALNLKALTNFKQENFRDAQKWYTVLMKEHPDSTQLIEKSKTMLASASFKVAESFKEEGDAKRAAIEFEKTAYKTQDKEIAEAALFEAAQQYENAGQLTKAATEFEAFYNKFPHSKNIESAVYHAASLRERQSQWLLAAKNYLDLNRFTSDPEKAASALYNAGLNYEKAKAWSSAIQVYNDFVTKYPDDDRLLEVMFKTGFAYEKSNNSVQAARVYAQIVDKYHWLQDRGKFADDYFVAQSLYQMGDMKYKEFTKIELKPPFQSHLKMKQQAFNKMLEYLIEVAKYNVAEWTTASFYTIGAAYEGFCHDILNSPAPSNLSESDLKNYWDMIDQQWILPLETEALKYYQTNEKIAADNSVDNDWVKKTKVRELYLKEKLASHLQFNDTIVKQTSTETEENEAPQKTDL